MFPSSPQQFLATARELQTRVRTIKARLVVPDYGWYPYEPLSAVALITELLTPVYTEIVAACGQNGVADLGCADGDLGILFAEMGATVDWVDHRESNYNQMRGLTTLQGALGLPQRAFDLDLDGRFELPQANYGLALFLGTLYHLKNPFYVLETLAKASDWCLVSTRVAQVTPEARIRIDREPLAYLLAPREANDDPTNFWIFSPAGLTRLVERAGWRVVAEKRVGCEQNSDPVKPEADERMFLLLKSRLRHPELDVRPLDGWYPAENDAWCWTAKQFSLQVALPEAERTSEFALRMTVPEAALAASPRVRVSCRVDGLPAGSMVCEIADSIEFRGRFPETTLRGATVRLDFLVESSFDGVPGDKRELGIIIPLLDASHRNTQRIPFRIS